MSVEDVWQEHKSFILPLVGGAAVLFIGWWIVTEKYEGSILASQNSARVATARAAQQKIPAGKLEEVKEVLSGLESRLAKIEKEYAYVAGEGFTLVGVDRDQDIRYNEKVDKLVSDVVEGALANDIRVPPDLGMGGITPKSVAEREWYLNGLDIVQRVSFAGIASGIRAIEAIQIQQPQQIGSRERREAIAPYLRSISVKFSIVGHPRAIDGVLRALVLPGQQLVLETATIQTMDDEGGKGWSPGGEQTVRLDMTVKALHIDSKGQPTRTKAQRL